MKTRGAGIVIQIDERVEIKNTEQRFEAYCSDCKAMTEMATPKSASAHCDISEREIYRLIESRAIHFVETDRVLVCLESVRKILAH
ncbi:MAG TPA: hypothetical protein VJL58_08845 [Pyrinomonadaceae bacterium]|nr:hypothetical protein [Pyrinomonadaceae bacterium]